MTTIQQIARAVLSACRIPKQTTHHDDDAREPAARDDRRTRYRPNSSVMLPLSRGLVRDTKKPRA
jgi:hypothetical protein